MAHVTTLRRWCLAAAVAALALVSASPAQAAHRARLGADLEEHLAAGSQAIDVIVHGTRAEIDALAARYSLRVKRYLRSGAVLRVTAGQLAALREDAGVDHLSSDLRIRSVADVTAVTIGADQVWAGSGGDGDGLSGAGIGVAVIDSGVDRRHEALRNRVAVSVDFIGGDGGDRFGHGTHVAAIIAGRGGRSADTAEYRGIAPGAHIVSLRVLDEQGAGLASDVIEAIDWAIEHRKAYNIKVINLSLGGPVLQPYRDDPMCEAVERAVAAGITVVAAAGNHGRSADGRRIVGGITTPGNDPSVITIGGLDTRGTAAPSDDGVASWSSRGPTRYDLVLKPDLVAPGSRVVSAEAAGSYLSRTYSERHVGGSGNGGYMELSGTSMAAGVASGAVALLLEGSGKLTPREAKTVLQASSRFMPGEGLIASGAGSLNVLAAAGMLEKGKGPSSPTVEIAGEVVRRSGLSFHDSAVEAAGMSAGGKGKKSRGVRGIGQAQALTWRTPGHDTTIESTGDTVLWGLEGGDTIIWALTGDTIIWGQSGGDTIIWGQSDGDTVVWGTSDTVVWGTADTIIWGQAVADTIIWGQNDGDTIIWGQSDTVIWGTTIIWGQSVSDTIIWGQNVGDTIIWGQISIGSFD